MAGKRDSRWPVIEIDRSVLEEAAAACEKLYLARSQEDELRLALINDLKSRVLRRYSEAMNGNPWKVFGEPCLRTDDPDIKCFPGDDSQAISMVARYLQKEHKIEVLRFLVRKVVGYRREDVS